MDTIIVPLSDMHSGGTTALFPDRFWQFQHGNHTPTHEQRNMFAHFRYCAEQIRQARKRKKLVVVHNGDAVDGTYFKSLQSITSLKQEQVDIHIELMDYFLRTVEFGKGDELYYVKGTEVHTNDNEDIIGGDLGAVKDGELHAWEELKIEVNGKRLWFCHRGPTAGKGANRGNTLRNWLRNLFYDAINENQEPPHYVITSHVHDPFWQTYVGRYKGRYHCVQGLITPSFQQRTRYAHSVAPLTQNKIGLQWFEITKEGLISDPIELIMV